jgi:hypothetical protein
MPRARLERGGLAALFKHRTFFFRRQETAAGLAGKVGRIFAGFAEKSGKGDFGLATPGSSINTCAPNYG